MMMGIQNEYGGEVGNWTLVTWVRGERTTACADGSSLKEIINPMIEGDFDLYKMQALVEVALQCVEEDRDERPTMKQVVEMLQTYENDWQ
ncbi:hypothetical protein L6164_020893 [Bauhinia variegata]|uniref:Uncharacterized protein n=1 Tax=Bauhinia variegata TaxID=167791 RepID=A0ACB9MYJ6_BAUVA|nr:hypothetical protein L6164_020893 [Bauhinia variegata]